MKIEVLTINEQIQMSLLSTIIDRSSSYSYLITNAMFKFERTFGKLPTASATAFKDQLKDLETQGYIKTQYDSMDNQTAYLSEGGVSFLDSLNAKLKKQVRDKLRHGDRDGIVSIAQKVIKNNRVLISVFLEPGSLYGIEKIPFCTMMLAAGKKEKDERIFLRLPLVDHLDAFTESGSLLIKDPNPAFVCVNAFAIFLTVQGTEVFVCRRVKLESSTETEYSPPCYTVETEVYDANNQPESFTLFENHEIEKVIRESKMEEYV